MGTILINVISVLSGLMTIATGLSAFCDVEVPSVSLFFVTFLLLILSLLGSSKFKLEVKNSKKQFQFFGSNNSQNMG